MVLVSLNLLNENHPHWRVIGIGPLEWQATNVSLSNLC
jgi:hypothetical protein